MNILGCSESCGRFVTCHCGHICLCLVLLGGHFEGDGDPEGFAKIAKSGLLSSLLIQIPNSILIQRGVCVYLERERSRGRARETKM